MMVRQNRQRLRRYCKQSWRSWALILSVTLICAVLTYGPFMMRGDLHSLAGYYDRWAYFGPMAYFMDYSLHHGEFPLWNPLIFCGVPFAANPQTGAFYPFNLLRSALTVTPTPLNALIGIAGLAAAHLVLASIAAFFCARAHRLSLAASVTVAITYTFGAAMTRRVPDLASFVCMAAWLPLLLFMLQRAYQTTQFWRAARWATVCGVTFGITILIGFPQLTMYMALILVCYSGLYRTLPTFWLPDSRRQLVRRAALLGWTFTLALLIAAPLILPASEFSHFAPRAKAMGEFYRDGTFHVSPLYLLRGLVTYPGITYPGSDGIRLAGTGVVLLAMASLLHRRRRDVAVFIIIFLVILDCSLGEDFPIGGFVAWLAPFKVVVPARASIFGCFILAMLAGYGVDALNHVPRSTWQRIGRFTFMVFPGIAILYLLWRWVSPDPSMAVSHIVWFIPAALLVTMLASTRIKTPSVLVWAFPVLVFAETLAWNVHYLPYLVTIYPYPGDVESLRTQSKLATANTRGVERQENENLWLCENLGMLTLHPSMGGYDPLYIARVRNTICPPGHENEYDREIKPGNLTRANQRGNLLLKRRFWLTQNYTDGPLPGKEALFPVAQTTFLTGATNLKIPRLESESVSTRSVSESARAEPISLINGRIDVVPDLAGKPGSDRTTTLPVFHMGPRHSALRLTYVASSSGALHVAFRDVVTGRVELGMDYPLQSASSPRELEYPLPDMTDVETTVTATMSETSAKLSLSNLTVWEDPVDQGGRISILSARANGVELLIHDLPHPAILTFVEAAYPGWNAYVDDHATPILLADDAFQAVELSAGSHTVRFEYHSRLLPAGLAIASGATALAAGMFLSSTKRLSKKQRLIGPIS